jgi:hypothetical protein
MAFISTPGKEEVNHRKTTGVEGEASCKSMLQVVEGDVVAVEADFSLIDGEEEAGGEFAQGLLEGPTEEQKVGGSKAVVGIASQDRLSVQVGAADGGVEVERDNATGVRDGACHQEANIDGAFEILRK